MAALNEAQRDVINLIKRSKPREDGWYAMSVAVWPLVRKAALPEELFETASIASCGWRIRPTEAGAVVMKWL